MTDDMRIPRARVLGARLSAVRQIKVTNAPTHRFEIQPSAAWRPPVFAKMRTVASLPGGRALESTRTSHIFRIVRQRRARGDRKRDLAIVLLNNGTITHDVLGTYREPLSVVMIG